MNARSRSLPRLYLISDAARTGEDRVLKVVESALGAGLRMVQLREPGWPRDRLAELAVRLRAFLGEEGLLTLSLHPGEDASERESLVRDLALPGVHLGRCGLESVATWRDRLGRELLLGYSAHSPNEARRALEAGADYVSCSPIFPPLSKEAAGEPLGLAGLRRASSSAAGAVYALGGITPERATAVGTTGAHGVAVVSALLDAPDPAAACRALLEPWSAPPPS